MDVYRNRSAYNILGVNSKLDSREGNGLSPNSKVKLNTINMLQMTFKEMNRILSNPDLLSEDKIFKLKKLADTQNILCLAYEQIKDEISRQQYDRKGKPYTHDEYLRKTEILAEESVLRCDENGKPKTKNAYDILSMKNHEHRTEEEYSRNIAQSTLSKIATTLSSSQLCSNEVKDFKKVTDGITNILWAYSKIGTQMQRKKYDIALKEEISKDIYTNLAERGKNALEYELRLWEYSGISEKYKQPKTFNHENGAITIRKVGAISYEDNPVMNTKSEPDLYVYEITKVNAEGETKVSHPISNINLVKMEENSDYRENILTELLSDESIHFGEKYLASYIGKIDANGKIEFDPMDIAACQLYEEKSRLAKEGKRVPRYWTSGEPLYVGGSAKKTKDIVYGRFVVNLPNDPDEPDTGDR